MKHLRGNELKDLLFSQTPKLFLWKQTNPNKHTVLDDPSCAYIRTPTDEYTCTFTHEDDYQSEWNNLKIKNCFTFGLKELWNLGFHLDQCIDLGYYIDPPEEPPLYDVYLNQLGLKQPLNNIIPLSKHLESWSDFTFNILWWWDRARSGFGQTPHTLWHIYAPRFFSQIERQGIGVDIPTFMKHYPNKDDIITSDGLVHSHYNFYTTTGRPSNAFGGVNFAAIPKHDGSRDSFISKNGVLVNVDFKAYHLHLLAKVLNMKLPKDPHTMLGKEYFNTDQLTDEQYEESKRITFKNLYSYGLDDKAATVSFFKQTFELEKELYEKYTKNLILYSHYGRKYQFDEPLTQNKVFNYYVQSLETEMNLIQLSRLLMSGCPSPILYTYDSFTFDIEESKISNLKDCLESNLIFPYKVTVGDTLRF